MKIDAVDLFCGAGGLSYGLIKAGIHVRAGLDFDQHCTFPYTTNIPKAKFLLEDISQTQASSLAKFYRKRSIKLLAGCAPCQPFSSLRNGTARQKSDKWPLLGHFSRLVQEIHPDLVTMENVPVLQTQSIYTDFVSALEQQGYFICAGVIDAAIYGVPQRRRRLVLLASRYGAIRMLKPEEIGAEKRTVRQAIGGLPPIHAGGSSKKDHLHKSRALTEINLERVNASIPGGTWEDWPERLKLACHQKESGASFKSVYGRLEWDKPSGTITTQSSNLGTGRFGHPVQHRALSLREMAILQSFPDDYKFIPDGEDVQFSSLGRLIGNAVPVDLAYAVGRSITLERRKKSDTMNWRVKG